MKNLNRLAMVFILLLAPAAWAQTYSLGATNLVEGPAAGSDSVVLGATNSWTATANDAWLHLSAGYQSGSVSTNVIFTFDANSGATRMGTMTIAGQTVTITQAGSTYVPITNTTTLVSSGLSSPIGMAVDGAGNVYIADIGSNLIKVWTAANSNITTLVSSGLSLPYGVAVDGAGNVYIADTYNNAIKVWKAADSNVTTLVSSGLSSPRGVAVDSAGNIYIADTDNNAIKKWTATNGTVTPLVSSGLFRPYSVAVDGAGNVYIADTYNNAIKMWTAANATVSTLVSSGLFRPSGVAVDGAGNVCIADTFNNAIKMWMAANGTVSTLVSSGLSNPSGVAMDGVGNVYIVDRYNSAIKERPRAFVDTAAKVETSSAGSDALLVVFPVTANLTGPFTPISDSSWLTITGVTNGVVSFAFTANNNPAIRIAFITLLGQSIAVIQLRPLNFSYSSLGTTNLLEGSLAGSDSVMLVAGGSWTATANATWLHLSAANQSGTSSTNVIFTFDANPGATRTGTLTIAGQTVTVTQAGSTYVPVTNLTTIVSSGLSGPSGLAVDAAGNVYIADYTNNVIKKWTATNNTITTLVSSGLNRPAGVAVDGAGNLFIADTGNNVIKVWMAANSNLNILVSSGLSSPRGVAVDSAGNIYIADTDNNAIKKWTATNGTVTTLVSSGLFGPYGVAVDGAGNVYIADTYNNAIKMWTAANGTVSTLVPSGLSSPSGVAVDGSGNIYIADNGNNAIKKWTATNNTITTLASSGLSSPRGVAVDGAGNVYIADTSTVKELPHSFVDPTPKTETASAASDALSMVLPATANLSGQFVPASYSTWLTITGITNGVVSFTFTANNFANRTARITLLGQSIAVTQSGPPNYSSLGTTNFLVGPMTGSNGVPLVANGSWTATTNATWLHLSAANQSGTGSTNVIFTFDANPGATRTGTLTIAGQTVTVTQAGSTYVATTNTVTLVSSGLSSPRGVAVDIAGNVYIADNGNNATKKWTATNNTVTTLVSSGLSSPRGVAVDIAGNIYIADNGNNAIKKWTAANSNVNTMVSSGLSSPSGVAVDGAGNAYIADTGNNAIKVWTAANSNVNTMVSSGLSSPSGVAVDGAGNAYIADTGNNAIKVWSAANNNIITLVSSGLSSPSGVAVDVAGNVYIADTGNNAIKVWTAANGNVTTLVSSGLSSPSGVAVDVAGNVYIADNSTIKELPNAFVVPTQKLEGLSAGTDNLAVLLPTTFKFTGPFAPFSDFSWLTITGITNGVVSFTFTANNFANRTARITLLGQSIAVTQSGPPNYSSLGTTNFLVSPMTGSNGVPLVANGSWTATTNATWLHLSAANQSGTGSTNVIFTFDANPGATRTGTLTIAGQTVTVTQAGSTYVATTNTVTLVSSGLSSPRGVAVDIAGNVYIADNGNNATKKWTATNNTVTTLVSSGLSSPRGVAVDIAGNVYIADNGNNAIKKWTAANSNVNTLVSSGLSSPSGVAVDGAGNAYIADTGNNAIKVWMAANSNIITLVSSGLSSPSGVAVDGAGNAYIADTGNNAIKVWMAANNNIITLVSSGLSSPSGVAVDVAGNVYIADTGNNAIKVWTAVNGNVTTLVSSGLSSPSGVTVDVAGNVYIANNSTIKELPNAFVVPTNMVKTAAAGSDALPVVVPATANLSRPFAVSDSFWLTITSITNGVVSLAYNTANNSLNYDVRIGRINLLGQSYSVTQQCLPYFSLATTNLLESTSAGSDSVTLAANTTWSATTNATWLHLSAANQSGTGSTNVIFTFDANPGATRTGTLTIAGQTVTVTQAGSTYVPVTNLTTIVSSGLSGPSGLAVDAAGNVYIADYTNNVIKKWTATNNTITTLVSSGLNQPAGVAVDGAGNLFIADYSNNAIKMWTASNSVITTLVSSGLSGPYGVAVDGAGNVYIADKNNNAIKKWIPVNDTITTLVSSAYLSAPSGVAVDAAGNLYIADTSHNAIKKWTAVNSNVTTLVSSGLSSPYGVAFDGSGNVFIADYGNNSIKKWIAASNTVTTLASNLRSPRGITADWAGNIYVADTGTNMIKELPRAFVDPTPKVEVPLLGNDTLPVIVATTANLSGPFAPTSDQSWVTIAGANNCVVSFTFTANSSYFSRSANITVLGQKTSITQQSATQLSLGTTNLVEGPAASFDSVALAAIIPWTATANATWLHLSAANQSGTGSTNVIFTFDANPGATRTGTLTIGSQTVFITQAGFTYVTVTNTTTLMSSGLSSPRGVAVDGTGNVYIADNGNNAIKKWTTASNTVTTLVSSGLSSPSGVAVDGAGNAYIADTGNNAIKIWSAANSNINTLVSSGLTSPTGVAVDGAGNVYIADNGNSAIKKWTATNSIVTTLLSSGLSSPSGVAVDGAGNVYIVDFGNNAIKKWTSANSNVTTLVSSGLSSPTGVAVDGAGNVYIADNGNSAIKKWIAASNTVITLVSGLNLPCSVAVDGAGNVYFADKNNNTIKELPHAFVDSTPKLEGLSAGIDTLPAVVPSTINLSWSFAPASDQAWLTISGVTNGVVSFAFTTNTSISSRSGNIILLGLNISITQQPVPQLSLGTTNLLEGPTSGCDSVALAANTTWTATANDAWLHFSAGYQSGTVSTNVVFMFDANSGATRTGTLTIAGQTVTVTQAGSTYVPITNLTTLVSSNAVTPLNKPYGVAVDGAGNVFIADSLNNAIKKWIITDNTVTTLVSSNAITPLKIPQGVAVDGAGNVYIADTYNNAIKKWNTADNTVTTLVASASVPNGVTLDSAGNVYFSAAGWGLNKWTASNGNVTNMSVFYNFGNPGGVAIDVVGNFYVSTPSYSVVEKWTAVNSNITTLVSSGSPYGVAVDGSGNVYVADSFFSTIKKWNAVNNTVTTLVSPVLRQPYGVAVDNAGNVYIADTYNNAIKELPRAFVDSTTKVQGALAGIDTLPVVVPATAILTGPFAPTSDSPWLTISGVNNGVVSYAFTANYTTNRTANITLLGQKIAVTQPAVLPPVLNNCTVLGNGALRFGFTNNQGATFTVWSATNMMLPFTNWTPLCTLTNNGSGQYNFTNPPGDSSQRFYRVTAP